jgi:hypothetical protein
VSEPDGLASAFEWIHHHAFGSCTNQHQHNWLGNVTRKARWRRPWCSYCRDRLPIARAVKIGDAP